MAVTLPQLGRRLAGQGHFDDILHVHDVEPVTGCRSPVDLQPVLRQIPIPVDKGPRHAGHLADLVEQLVGTGFKRCQVVTKHLDDNLAIDLRDRFENLVAYRLAERRLDAGKIVQLVFHLTDQLVLGHTLAPGRFRLQVDQHLGHVDVFWVGTVFRPATFGNSRVYLGEIGNHTAQLA